MEQGNGTFFGENRGGGRDPKAERLKRRESNRGLRAVRDQTRKKAEELAQQIESTIPPPITITIPPDTQKEKEKDPK